MRPPCKGACSDPSSSSRHRGRTGRAGSTHGGLRHHVRPAPSPAGTQAASTRAPGQIVEDSLRAYGSRTGLRIGTAVNTDLLGADARYTDLVDTQFNTVTPDNVG